MISVLVERDEPATSSAPRRGSTEAAGHRLRAMAKEDGCRASISVNGGPQIPFDEEHEGQIMRELAPVVARGIAAADDNARKPRPGGIAADQLRSIVERIERLQVEAADIASDIKDIFAESKGNGYDVKTLRKVLALRKQDASERDEAEHLLDTYCIALGMKAQLEMFDEPHPSTEPDGDRELYAQAVSIVQADRNASTSYLQRMLRLGYNHAAQLMERLERDGIVSAANHVGRREVLRRDLAR